MSHDRLSEELLRLSDVPCSLRERSDAVLAALARPLEFDAAWLTVRDPRLGAAAVVSSCGIGRPDLDYLAAGLPLHPERAHADQTAEPVDHDRCRWSGYVTPSGLRGVAGVDLCEADGEPIGLLLVLDRADRASRSAAGEQLALHALPIARALSPMRSLLPCVRLAPDASAGIALLPNGSTAALPGWEDHALLAARSPVVRVARRMLMLGQRFGTFLWPTGAEGGDGGHVRLAVVVVPELSGLVDGIVLLTPDADCRGVTPRELEVLGLLVDGRSNQEIAHRLAVAPRTVAAHVEHVMRKLDAPSRTLAAVRAEREGCYVPAPSADHGLRPADDEAGATSSARRRSGVGGV